MTRNLDPHKMTHAALQVAQEEFNPRTLEDNNEVLAAVCKEIYSMPPEKFREYLINRSRNLLGA